MSKYARKIDNNQQEIVTALRSIPGVTVALNHDDVLCGYKGKTYWYELKNPNQVSKKTNKVYISAIKKSQQYLIDNWTGHFKIVWSLEQIIEDMAISKE